MRRRELLWKRRPFGELFGMKSLQSFLSLWLKRGLHRTTELLRLEKSAEIIQL